VVVHTRIEIALLRLIVEASQREAVVEEEAVEDEDTQTAEARTEARREATAEDSTSPEAQPSKPINSSMSHIALLTHSFFALLPPNHALLPTRPCLRSLIQATQPTCFRSHARFSQAYALVQGSLGELATILSVFKRMRFICSRDSAMYILGPTSKTHSGFLRVLSDFIAIQTSFSRRAWRRVQLSGRQRTRETL